MYVTCTRTTTTVNVRPVRSAILQPNVRVHHVSSFISVAMAWRWLRPWVWGGWGVVEHGSMHAKLHGIRAPCPWPLQYSDRTTNAFASSGIMLVHVRICCLSSLYLSLPFTRNVNVVRAQKLYDQLTLDTLNRLTNKVNYWCHHPTSQFSMYATRFRVEYRMIPVGCNGAEAAPAHVVERRETESE